MNPFEKLSDDPILHIFSYLPRKDLLNLSQMDKNFNRIITKSKETKAMIPLILDFKHKHAINDVMKVARKRQFTALKLKNINKKIPARKFQKLLKLLCESVEHLVITQSKVNKTFLNTLIQMFLPMLKTCDIQGITICNAQEEINDEVVSNRNLRHLRVCNAEILKFFAGCKQLKSFHISGPLNDHFYDFLSHQTKLEKLITERNLVDFNRIKCFQLKELGLECASRAGVSDYLKKLSNLRRLNVVIIKGACFNDLMTIIRKVPKLVHLTIQIRCEMQKHISSLKKFKNRTVKKLVIAGCGEIIGWLLQVFRGVESINIKSRNKHSLVSFLDPNDLPRGTIDKIKFDCVQAPIHILFNPTTVPANVESFEAAVMNFAEKFSSIIGKITIGHENWSNDKDFRLSHLFCKDIVKCLRNLVSLELFNVADRGKLISFLDDNCKTLRKLKKVKLRKPNDVESLGEPVKKKMRIITDAEFKKYDIW